IYIYIVAVRCPATPGFSTRQVEGLQRVNVLQRKLTFRFPHLFIKFVLGSGAWRFRRDLGGMESPIRGPGFENPQHSDCTGVCRPFYRVLTIVLGSTPADRSQAGSTPAVRSQAGST
ncbi:unnamed protein product, partial [Staurois parvus]